MLLREVLDAFEQTGPLSLAQLARRLDIEPNALEGMIQFWVNKGKLREVSNQQCSTCGVQHTCPLPSVIPRRYERVARDGTSIDSIPVCQCGRRLPGEGQ